jgi:hypothetical protein
MARARRNRAGIPSTNLAAAVSENRPRGCRAMVTYAPSWSVTT